MAWTVNPWVLFFDACCWILPMPDWDQVRPRPLLTSSHVADFFLSQAHAFKTLTQAHAFKRWHISDPIWLSNANLTKFMSLFRSSQLESSFKCFNSNNLLRGRGMQKQYQIGNYEGFNECKFFVRMKGLIFWLEWIINSAGVGTMRL